MNKILTWWVSVRQTRADVAYWKREAGKWERKYAAAIQVRDSLSGQLEKTQAALIEAVGKVQALEDELDDIPPISDWAGL